MRFYFLVFFVFLITSLPVCAFPGTGEKDTKQDTLKNHQDLYIGKVWTNRFQYVKEGQFMFADYYLPGKIYFNGKKYPNILLKYDVHSDEILTPVSDYEIMQLNKEMADSFSVSFEGRIYRFINIKDSGPKGFEGYVNVLYQGSSSVYIKYRKVITSDFNDKNIANFYLYRQLFVVNGGNIIPITRKDDLPGCFPEYAGQIREYIRKTRLRVSPRRPESIVQVVSYADGLKKSVL